MPPPESPQHVPDDTQYEAFYGLNEQPFAISTDPKFLFLSASHQRAYQELLTGLQRHEGLMLLTGEAGTGKTTLCRGVIDALGERTFSAILLNPYMSGAELLKVVLKEFGLVTREELRRGALARAEPPQLLDAIEGFLLSVRSIESRAVIVVDEAQSLSPPVLDQVRLLTALERQGKPLLQIIIGGQPKLIETLKKDVMYALSERITRRVHLAPLLADEIHAYITHRLTVAGGADNVEFLPEATTVVAELSRGLPRRVNLLCDRSLQEGRYEEARKITSEMVRRAARSLAGAQPKTDAPSDSIADGVPDAPAARPRPAAPAGAAAEGHTTSASSAGEAPAEAPAGTPGRTAPPDDMPAIWTSTPDRVSGGGQPREVNAAEAAASAFRGESRAAGSTLFDTPAPASTERRAARPDRAAHPEHERSGEAAAEALIQRFKDGGASAEPAAEPTVMFGQGVQERSRRWRWLSVAALLVLVGGAVYGYVAWTMVNDAAATTPRAPAAPELIADAPPWPKPLPVPSDEDVAAGLEQLRLLRLLNAQGGGSGSGSDGS